MLFKTKRRGVRTRDCGCGHTFSQPDLRIAATHFMAMSPFSLAIVAAFVQRMQALAATSLSNSREAVVFDPIVHVFGNGAGAVADCEIVENNAITNRGVEMILLVKDDGVWIAAQAWDSENVMRRIPDELLDVRAT